MHNSPFIQHKITSRMEVVEMGYDTPCWISDRAEAGKGYTKLGINGVTMLTHRVAYQAWRGPIPDGLIIDHLCRNRACCNPSHLEPVTYRENLMRGETLTASEAAQTHCKRGHAFDAANTYYRPDRHGRICRTCSADAARRRRQLVAT